MSSRNHQNIYLSDLFGNYPKISIKLNAPPCIYHTFRIIFRPRIEILKEYKRFICRLRLIYAPGLLLLLLCSSVGAQSPHPDGAVGVFNARMWGQYASVTGDINTPLYNDKQQIGIDIRLPVHRQASLITGYFLEPGDTVFHNISFGVRIYTGDPTMPRGRVNPDGPVGLPVVDLGIGGRIPDQDPDSLYWNTSLAVRFPTTTHFTIGAGWHYLEQEDIRQADEFYGLLAYYPGIYQPGQEYHNPDGPVGQPAFLLMGGGSENGVFGHLDIVFPMQKNYTLGLYIRGERIPIPYTRSAILGGWVHFYPGIL